VIIDALKWCQKIGTEADLGDYDEFVADRQLHIPKLCTVERNDVVQESSDRALESLLLVQPFEHYFGEHSTSTPAVFFVA
jgi:hypothetical protein